MLAVPEYRPARETVGSPDGPRKPAATKAQSAIGRGGREATGGVKPARCRGNCFRNSTVGNSVQRVGQAIRAERGSCPFSAGTPPAVQTLGQRPDTTWGMYGGLHPPPRGLAGKLPWQCRGIGCAAWQAARKVPLKWTPGPTCGQFAGEQVQTWTA